jgi:hypothetical protein
MLQASELRSSLTFYMEIFISGVNHTFENTSLVLQTKRKYHVLSNTQSKIFESLPAFSWSLQTSADIVP